MRWYVQAERWPSHTYKGGCFWSYFHGAMISKGWPSPRHFAEVVMFASIWHSKLPPTVANTPCKAYSYFYLVQYFLTEFFKIWVRFFEKQVKFVRKYRKIYVVHQYHYIYHDTNDHAIFLTFQSYISTHLVWRSRFRCQFSLSPVLCSLHAHAQCHLQSTVTRACHAYTTTNVLHRYTAYFSSQQQRFFKLFFWDQAWRNHYIHR